MKNKTENSDNACPECGSKNIIMFTSDDDICNDCGYTFAGVISSTNDVDRLKKENAALREAVKELIPIAECTVIPDGPEKDLVKEIWPGTYGQMEKRQAAIEKARNLIK